MPTMAVSHQWFLQWSAPPMLIADISSRYNNVNERWKDVDPKWSEPLERPPQSDDTVNNYSNDERFQNNKYQAISDGHKNSGKFLYYFFTT